MGHETERERRMNAEEKRGGYVMNTFYGKSWLRYTIDGSKYIHFVFCCLIVLCVVVDFDGAASQGLCLIRIITLTDVNAGIEIFGTMIEIFLPIPFNGSRHASGPR